MPLGQIYSLFPIALGHYKLNRRLTETELHTIQQTSQKSNTGNRVSVSDQVCESAELSSLTEFFQTSLNDYVQQVHAPAGTQVVISSSWINWSRTGEHHHKHTHTNSFISGVFYVQTNPDDKIWFHDDTHKWLSMPKSVYTNWNSEQFYYKVTQGDLYLFPSNLPHSVAVVQGAQERISLSFNTWPKGILGDTNTKTSLQLT